MVDCKENDKFDLGVKGLISIYNRDVAYKLMEWNLNFTLQALSLYISPMLVTRQKKSLYFFINLKTDHLSYSLYKHDNINIAYPSSMQDMCLLLLNRPQSS